MTSPRSPTWRRAAGAALALALGSVPWTEPIPAVAAPPGQAAGGITYRLVDTWEDATWQLTAGRFGTVSDVSSSSDGTIYVLDLMNRAVHVLDRTGAARSVFRVPWPGDAEEGWYAYALDAGFDGRPYVLLHGHDAERAGGGYPSYVIRFSADGEVEQITRLPNLQNYMGYRDLAVGPDGRLFVTRSGPPAGWWSDWQSDAVEVFGTDGLLQAVLEPPELELPGRLDIDSDGTIYVTNRVPSPSPEEEPGPTPTPRPSLALMRGINQHEGPTEGVVVFGPDHQLREVVPADALVDIAVGANGVFLARHLEVFALGEREPRFTGPSSFSYQSTLDVTADGRVLFGVDHCYFHGLMVFGRPNEPSWSARYIGANDSWWLEGPPFPLRIAADEEVAVLQGPYVAEGEAGDRTYLVDPFVGETFQTVQRWSPATQAGDSSAPRSQLGVCGAGSPFGYYYYYAMFAGMSERDVAVDGADIYTIGRDLLHLRPDDHWPRWSTSPAMEVDPVGRTDLVAVDARDGRAAILDGGLGAVHLVDRTGALASSWSAAAGRRRGVPRDLALGDDRLFLAEPGARRVAVRALDGASVTSWPTHDTPTSIALGPTGDVFVLGGGGWVHRHRPDGQLRASWPVPEPGMDASDVAVDTAGRVYVSFAEFDGVDDPAQMHAESEVSRGGVWVFEEAPVPLPEAPKPASCMARADKVAAPVRLPLGEAVTVSLRVDGRCPGIYDPVQVVVVFDRSRSMSFVNSMGRAREILATFLAALDPQASEVGLVAFADDGALLAPLSRDLAGVAHLAANLQAAGDTFLRSGLDLAGDELIGPRGDPNARRFVLIVSDGAFHDDARSTILDLQDRGIQTHALLASNDDTDMVHPVLEHLADEGGIVVDPNRHEVVARADRFANYRSIEPPFTSLNVVDEVPSNMVYVAGSAAPPATWDPDRRRLSWTLTPTTDSVVLTYRLEPTRTGTWPTNVRADADYRDGLGNDGRLRFPIPEVHVYGSRHDAFLPFAAARSCFRTDLDLDVVLVLDGSSSMAEPSESGTGTKLEAAREAANAFLDLLRWPGDHAAVVSFDATAHRHSGLVGDPAELRSALALIRTAPGTHIDLGLKEARAVLAVDARPGARPVVVLVSDGRNTAGPNPVLAEATRLKASGALVYAISVGRHPDVATLSEVATTAEHHLTSPTTAELADVFRRLLDLLACERR